MNKNQRKSRASNDAISRYTMKNIAFSTRELLGKNSECFSTGDCQRCYFVGAQFIENYKIFHFMYSFETQ